MTYWLRIAIRGVTRNWRLSAFAVLGAASALVASSLIRGYYVDIEKLFRGIYTDKQMIGDVIIENSIKGALLSPAAQGFITSELRGASDIYARFLNVGGFVSNGDLNTVFIGVGFDLKGGELLRGKWAWNTLAGHPIRDDNSINTGIVLGESLGCSAKFTTKVRVDKVMPDETQPLACKSGTLLQLSTTTKAGRYNAINVEQVGLIDGGFKDLDSKLLTMSLPLAQQLLGTDEVAWFSVALKPGISAPKFVETFNSHAKEQGLPLQAVPWEKHALGELFLRTMALSSIFKIFIGFIIMAVTGMSLFNTWLKAIHERTREIGTLQSMGYLPRQILFIIGAEACMLGILSAIVGTILYFSIAMAINALEIPYNGGMLASSVGFSISTEYYVPIPYAFLIIFLSFFAALLPTAKVLRRNAADNLAEV